MQLSFYRITQSEEVCGKQLVEEGLSKMRTVRKEGGKQIYAKMRTLHRNSFYNKYEKWLAYELSAKKAFSLN